MRLWNIQVLGLDCNGSKESSKATPLEQAFEATLQITSEETDCFLTH